MEVWARAEPAEDRGRPAHRSPAAFYLGRWWNGNTRRSQKTLLRRGSSNLLSRTRPAMSEANAFESCRLRQIVQRGGRVGKVTSPENWRALARATGGSIPSPSAKFPRPRGAEKVRWCLRSCDSDSVTSRWKSNLPYRDLIRVRGERLSLIGAAGR